MQRRKFIASIGSVAAGAAAVTGTGAFTSVTAERGVDVSVAGDSDSFLALNPADGPNGAYAKQTGDENTLEFNFDEQPEDVAGTGLNPGATTVIDDIFTIENRGTQDVGIKISADFETSLGDGSFTIFDGSDPDGNDLSGGYTNLTTGNSLSVGVEIETGQPANLTGTVTIDADAAEFTD